MDLKKIVTVLCFVACASILVGVAMADIIDPSNDPTPNPTPDTTIDIAKDDETALKQWYTKLEDNIDDGLVVEDVKNYEDGTIYFKLYKDKLFNGAETDSTSLFKCVDLNTDTGECYMEGMKTKADLDADKKALVEARIGEVADAAKTRLEGKTEAVVGTGEVTVNVK